MTTNRRSLLSLFTGLPFFARRANAQEAKAVPLKGSNGCVVSVAHIQDGKPTAVFGESFLFGTTKSVYPDMVEVPEGYGVCIRTRLRVNEFSMGYVRRPDGTLEQWVLKDVPGWGRAKLGVLYAINGKATA